MKHVLTFENCFQICALVCAAVMYATNHEEAAVGFLALAVGQHVSRPSFKRPE